MSICNFFFPYTGRKKQYENDIVFNSINDFDNFTTIVEPFGGSMSFSQYLYLKKGRTDLKYIYNDTDVNIFNFFNYIHDKGMDGFKLLCDNPLIEKTKNDTSIHTTKKSVQDYFNLKINHSETAFRKQYVVKKIPSKYSKHIDFIQHINKFYNKDYYDIFNKYKNREDVLMYIDPPYFKSYNSDYFTQKNIDYDMTKILVDIIDLFNNSKCHIVYVHNKNALMDYLFKDFPPIKEYKKIYQMTKKKCVHSVRYK